MVVGNKALECFTWSAAHDDDAEFVRRYGAEGRLEMLRTMHGDVPAAQAGLQRLTQLLTPPKSR